MKVLVAIDSLKGSLSSLEAGAAIKEGILRAHPQAQVVISPLADGGEGTVEALTLGMGGRLEKVTVTGPMGQPVEAIYGLLEASDNREKTVLMEVAQAAGITLVAPKDRNPLLATSYGVGEMIAHALDLGARHFIIGLGGTVTNDAGAGMLQALGMKLMDEKGRDLAWGGGALQKLAKIETSQLHPALKEASFSIACDVTNPLTGDLGASAIYGPQKGASSQMVADLDAALTHFAQVAQTNLTAIHPNQAGAGAAGGLGFAFASFLSGDLQPGVDLVLKETRLAQEVESADIVVTGEGRLDAQTAMGKAPIGVAKLAKAYDKKVIAFAGGVTSDARACNAAGIDAFFPIVRGVTSLEEAMNPEKARANMVDSVEQVFRLL